MEVKEYEDGWYVGGLTDRDIRSAGGSFKNLHVLFHSFAVGDKYRNTMRPRLYRPHSFLRVAVVIFHSM